MLITKTIEIDMGHRVPNHKSKCRNFHGHRYVFEVGVDDVVVGTKGMSNEGMVIDFSDLKSVMMMCIDERFDHGFMMADSDPLLKAFSKIAIDEQMKFIVVPFIPTAENIAKYVYYLMKAELIKYKIKIKHVKVWETPTSTATYEVSE